MFYDGLAEFIGHVGAWVAGFDSWQQIGALMLVSTLPFVESYLGSFLGVIVGVPAGVAVIAASLGNAASTFGLIAGASRARSIAVQGREKPLTERQLRRQEKVRKYLDRFGVPGVSMLGPLALPSQFTAPALVALGASTQRVYFWMGLSIIAWGVLFGFFSHVVVGWIA